MIFIITGKRKAGKSTLLMQIQEELKEQFSLGGIITIGQDEREFFNPQTHETRVFLDSQRTKNTGVFDVGKYQISKEALAFAQSSIENSVRCDIIIVDEIGKLEMTNKGLITGFTFLMQNIQPEKQILLLSVRKSILSTFIERYKIEPKRVWKIDRKIRYNIKDRILRELKNAMTN